MPTDDHIDFSMFLDDYLNDAREGFQACNNALLALEKDYSRLSCLDEIFRVVHTIKSASTMLEFSHIADIAHISEDLLDHMRNEDVPVSQETIDLLFAIVDMMEKMVLTCAECRREKTDLPYDRFEKNIAELKDRLHRLDMEIHSAGHSSHSALQEDNSTGTDQLPSGLPAIEKITTVRVSIELLDNLFNLVGELIIVKNRIDNLLIDNQKKELKTAMSVLERIINTLQESVSAARMVPVDEIFQKFPRMVRDLAKDHGKQVDFVMMGRDIELDKAMLDAMGDPLIHLLRNAVDHGVESPEEREKFGKAKMGTIRLIAERAENHVMLHVEDDGCGINVARMKELAARKGFANAEDVQTLEDKDVYNLLFLPGFSSAEKVSDVSGRGVGLDVVKTVTEKLSGTIEVATQKDRGTRFTLKLPLATAIMQTLMVGVGEHVFAIPSDIVVETLEVKSAQIKEIQNDRVLILRQEVIPFIMLGKLMQIPVRESQENPVALIISRGDKLYGLGVDTVIDQMENIIKPFDPIAQQFKGFSGGTILGDGRVALLLDIPALLDFK